jgi:hypothetical protein
LRLHAVDGKCGGHPILPAEQTARGTFVLQRARTLSACCCRSGWRNPPGRAKEMRPRRFKPSAAALVMQDG